MSSSTRAQQRKKRHVRVRKRVSGSAARPRLCVIRTNRHIGAALVNDETGATLASVSTSQKTLKGKASKKVESAKQIGTMIAGKAKELGVEEVVFDRGGFLYHGRVKALADSAREAGLRF